MPGTVNNLTVKQSGNGKKVISFQLISDGNNVSANAANALAPLESLATLPESLPFNPKEWCGIGEGCPVRMQLVGEGNEATLQFMFNSPYTDQALTEHSAMMQLPDILERSALLAPGQGQVLKQTIESHIPPTEAVSLGFRRV